MKTTFDQKIKGMVTLDNKDVARQILHLQQPYDCEAEVPRQAAIDYAIQMADRFKITPNQLKSANKKVDYFNPKTQEMEFRQSVERHFFDSVTVEFTQTLNNVPIWRKGLGITMQKNPIAVMHAANNTVKEFKAKLPTENKIRYFQEIFATLQSRPYIKLLTKEGQIDDEKTGPLVRSFILHSDFNKTSANLKSQHPARLHQGRFFYYKFDADNRQPKGEAQISKRDKFSFNTEIHDHPQLDLQPVDISIKDGQYYLVAEITFAWKVAGKEMSNWLALVELETSSILYAESLAAGVNGLVFNQDPLTKTGVLTNTANNSNTVLNALRDDVTLPALDAPDNAGKQHLSGTYVHIVDVDGRTVSPPTTSGGDFDFNVRTNDFAAVSAYFHASNFFSTVESLGFNLATFFPGTTFPVDIDHSDQSDVNAHCVGNGSFGIDHSGYGYGDDTNTTDPSIGRAVDKYVHWHEIGGHGVLYGFVNTANFGFSHSAGDGLAGIQNDPTSELRATGSIERFRYAPFRYNPLDRWLNRDVTSGWGWGGSLDLGGYNSEQILGTTHFRLYRSIGGDSAYLNKRQFASRMATYLILRAISTLTPGTNPNNPLGFCNALMAVDLLDWTSEGISGGAYNKVIRWAFEKQGLFQPAGAPTPVITEGTPPAVDVYIEDGRTGEYDFQEVFWNNTSIWNRTHPDGGLIHEDPVKGSTNYAYVKIKNRGTLTANNITVRGFNCIPGGGLVWPGDFQEMGPVGGLPVATLGANSLEEIIVGPFTWSPNVNIYGHDCMLMIASCAEDPSNIDNFTVGDTIPEWRLVPNDNNVGQRNVDIAPAESGESLLAHLDGRNFFIGNSFPKKANAEVHIQLPNFLTNKGWKISVAEMTGKSLLLKSGEKRMLSLKVTKGTAFNKSELMDASQKDITISILVNGILMGGMTYRLDANKHAVTTIKDDNCKIAATELLNCLNLGTNRVKKVCVKKVSLDIEIDNDCKC
ncbi:hypothetical protein [Flavobacterium sp. H122]|uniref:hypothetical protein n=1 Tax=Flavobacterium sp. H122 TaxID=2529860 RepID=UPI0010AAFD07|nr:hypothetical protein [Flavobacterium sp. H122]